MSCDCDACVVDQALDVMRAAKAEILRRPGWVDVATARAFERAREIVLELGGAGCLEVLEGA